MNIQVKKNKSAFGGNKYNSLDGIIPPESNSTSNISQYVSLTDEYTTDPHKIETFLESISDFAFTITFTDYNIHTYTRQHLTAIIQKALDQTRNIIKYCFVAELSKVGRFHYHGSIKVSKLSAVENLRKRLSHLGKIKIKKVDNSPKWAHYCMKSYDHEKCVLTDQDYNDGKYILAKHFIIRNH